VVYDLVLESSGWEGRSTRIRWDTETGEITGPDEWFVNYLREGCERVKEAEGEYITPSLDNPIGGWISDPLHREGDMAIVIGTLGYKIREVLGPFMPPPPEYYKPKEGEIVVY
jgi:hypothetical protein